MLKMIAFARIIKDVIVYMAYAWVLTVLYCVCVQNGWLPQNLLKESIAITYEEFKRVLQCLFLLIPFIMFFNGMCGKYIRRISGIRVEITIGTDDSCIRE